MDKYQVAAALDEMGTLLELQGENPFRCNAYHNAARTLEQLETNLADIVAQGKLGDIHGIGDTLQEKITTLVTTGALPFLDNLRAKTPPGLLTMMRVQSLGPKKVRTLYEQLKVDDLDKLKAACEAGQVAKLKGFGVKTQQKILEGIQFLNDMGERKRIDQALPLALTLLDGLRDAPGIIRMELCGSLRRRKETINDIDILISSAAPAPIMERFIALPEVVQVTNHGDTKSSIIASQHPGASKVMMNVDLRVVSDAQFPFALHYFTGNKEHNIAMRVRAQTYGLKLNEYELAPLGSGQETSPQRGVKCKDEADVFKALDLAYIPPEMREHTGELEAAATDTVPQLVEADDIQGVFHCHTVASDGSNTLEEMAEATKALGLKYLGIGDHSRSLTVANGLSVERVYEQQAAIDALNKKLKGIKLFKGTECDILTDGALDFPDEVLATFDYVVASVHTHFNQSREEMTSRIVKALQNPYVTMLGHATGRLLLRRDSYAVDLEAVLQAAAQENKLIEINAHPMRLDLDWVHCKRAKTLGVKLVINPDAHNTHDLAYYRYGVDVARRGWLTRHDVFNTLSAAQVTKELAKRKP